MKIRLTIQVWWKSLLVLAILAFLFSGLVSITLPSNTLLQVITGFGTLIGGVAGLLSVWRLLDKKAERLLFLTQQVRNQIENEAKSAISQLNAEGYLHDGSLKGADFSNARLSGVDLKAKNHRGAHIAANLEKVNFKQANLSNSDMRGINLKRSRLQQTILAGAWLMEADLRGANFECTNLQGAKLLQANLNDTKFKGVLLDENTILPDGNKWTESTDLSIFGIMDLDKIPSHKMYLEKRSEDSTDDPVRLKRLASESSAETEDLSISNDKQDLSNA